MPENEFDIQEKETKQYISVKIGEEKFGIDMYSVFGKKLNFHLNATKMLEKKGKKIVLSKKAYYVCNAVMCDFLI